MLRRRLKLKHFAGVTVGQLLSHSSKTDWYSEKNLVGYKYQNLNFDLVGLILEKQTHKSYAESVRELFREAGMVHTFLHDDFPERELFGKLKKSLQSVNRSPEIMKTVLTKAVTPDGGIISTARDLLKWNDFLEKNGYFYKLTEFSVDDGSGGMYGFGLATNSSKSFFFHNGDVLLYFNGICCAGVLLYEPSTKFSAVGFDVFEICPGQKILSLSEVEKFFAENNDSVLQKILERTDMLAQKCLEP
jgi:CubicO group peptidase (beta-lactamase class C family)